MLATSVVTSCVSNKPGCRHVLADNISLIKIRHIHQQKLKKQYIRHIQKANYNLAHILGFRQVVEAVVKYDDNTLSFVYIPFKTRKVQPIRKIIHYVYDEIDYDYWRIDNNDKKIKSVEVNDLVHAWCSDTKPLLYPGVIEYDPRGYPKLPCDNCFNADDDNIHESWCPLMVDEDDDMINPALSDV